MKPTIQKTFGACTDEGVLNFSVLQDPNWETPETLTLAERLEELLSWMPDMSILQNSKEETLTLTEKLEFLADMNPEFKAFLSIIIKKIQVVARVKFEHYLTQTKGAVSRILVPSGAFFDDPLFKNPKLRMFLDPLAFKKMIQDTVLGICLKAPHINAHNILPLFIENDLESFKDHLISQYSIEEHLKLPEGNFPFSFSFYGPIPNTEFRWSEAYHDLCIGTQMGCPEGDLEKLDRDYMPQESAYFYLLTFESEKLGIRKVLAIRSNCLMPGEENAEDPIGV